MRGSSEGKEVKANSLLCGSEEDSPEFEVFSHRCWDIGFPFKSAPLVEETDPAEEVAGRWNDIAGVVQSPYETLQVFGFASLGI